MNAVRPMLLPAALMAGAVMCLTASPLQARLGETREECVARYGQPVMEGPALLETASSATFLKGEIRIRIEFLENKAAFLSFSRRGLKQEERQTLLDANCGPLVWSAPAEFLGRMCWKAAGNLSAPARHASAYQMGDSNYLDVASDAWAQAIKSQMAVQFAIKPWTSSPAAEASGDREPATGLPKAAGTLEGF